MMTEEKVKELTKDIQRRIKSTNRWLSANKSIGSPEGEAFRQIEIYELALTALTHPASPALKFPDAKPVDLADENWDDVSLAENIGFNRCLLEVKRLNAPHTAPIEPICATGGAEWVKCSARMPPKGKPGTSREYLVYETLNNRVQHDYYNIPETMPPFWNHYGKYVTHWMPLPAAPIS